MTNEQIIEMAKQANVSIRGHYDETGSTPAELQRFAQMVRNAALEEAAIACQGWSKSSSVTYLGSSCREAASRITGMKS